MHGVDSIAIGLPRLHAGVGGRGHIGSWFADVVVEFAALFSCRSLNDSGVSFLELCDGRRSAAEIIGGLADQFDVQREILAKDLEPFLEELAESGVIRRLTAA